MPKSFNQFLIVVLFSGIVMALLSQFALGDIQQLGEIVGDGSQGQLGLSIGNIGDFDGDGYDDLIVADCPNNCCDSRSGTVYIISSQSFDTLATFIGEAPAIRFGKKVVGIPDVDNDGVNDVVITADVYQPSGVFGRGKLYFYSGKTGNLLFDFVGEGSQDQLGAGLACAGDANGDGVNDIIVGATLNDEASYNAGKAYILSGVDGTIVTEYVGENSHDGFGFFVGTIGDIYGDSKEEIFIGAPGYDAGAVNGGRVYILDVSSGDTVLTIDGYVPNGFLGGAVVTPGDINGDGVNDIVIGAPGRYDTSVGAVYAYSGHDGSLLYSITGPSFTGQFGRFVFTVGDVNCDNYGDFIVTSYQNNDCGYWSGQINGISGVDGSVIFTHCGNASNEMFGWDGIGLFDSNANGVLDFWVGSLQYDAGSGIVGKISSFEYNCEKINLALDIKPGSCPNPLNMNDPDFYIWEPPDEESGNDLGIDDLNALKPNPGGPVKKRAVLPAAILGTADFDVSEINPETISLQGVPLLRWNYEDVSTPMPPGVAVCECNTDGGDGYMDMTLKFDRGNLKEAISGVYDGDVVTLTVAGELKDGTPFEGTDCIVIRGNFEPEGLPFTNSSFNSDQSGLLGNYPNPFNPTTTIGFNLSTASHVRLDVYNVSGQKIASLLDEYKSAGVHFVKWDGKSVSGGQVASGIYFYRLEAGRDSDTKKMILMK